LSTAAALQHCIDSGDDFRIVDLSHAIEAGGHVVRSEENAVKAGYSGDIFDAADGIAVFGLDDDDDFIVGVSDVITEPRSVSLGTSDADSAFPDRSIACAAYDLLS